MILKNIKDIIVSAIILILLLALVIVKCKYSNTRDQYTASIISKLEQEQKEKALFEDTLAFVRGQADLQSNINIAKTQRIIELEHNIDSIIKKHNKTKKEIKTYDYDTGFVLAPNEYINECEGCFNILDTYKKENIQLRFERNAYDTLMRKQSEIQSTRILDLEREKNTWKKAFTDLGYSNTKDTIKVTRKLKISAMGMLNDLFLPNGGGGGLIYEDKKFNEYGAHVLLTGRGNIYLLHVAKTISFKRKK